jgi:branched-chain amino acid transport system substrate-binding protein
MKRALGILGLLGVISLGSVAAAFAQSSSSAGPAGAAAFSCSAPTIGIAAPLTGPAAVIGQEQLSWLQYSIANFKKRYGTSFTLKQGDTQLSASLARTVAQKFVSDSSMLGVVGGSTSQSVISSGILYKRNSMASVSGSATRASLTNGSYPTFFRVIPNDTVQAASIVGFATKNLKAKSVMVIDSQDDYSTALAAGMTPRFRAKGVKVTRASVAATDTDFSSIVTNVSSSINVVIFATQTASAANTLANQLREQGKKAVVLGTDGAFSPSEYKPKLGYVSSFAPDIRNIPSDRALVAGYAKFAPGKTWGTFGPATYLAGWVVMDAIRKACADGRVNRAEVVRQVKRTNLPSILGGTLRFTPKGDAAGINWYFFRITSGKYTYVA